VGPPAAASASASAPAGPPVAPASPAPVGSVYGASVGSAPAAMAAGGSAPGLAQGAPREPATSEFGATEIRPSPLYGGGQPPPPAPPHGPSSDAAKRRGVLIMGGVIGLVLVVVLGGLAWALLGGDKDPGQQQAGNQTTNSPGPVASSAPALPADEQCTDQIKSNTRWVCLTKATFDGNEIRIEYEAGDNGSPFDISGGFHLHIYGANADGSAPPDRVMGTHSSNRGAWYVEDQNPSVHPVGSNQYDVVEGHPKVCARIADSRHRLVEDSDGNYVTGNCVPVQEI